MGINLSDDKRMYEDLKRHIGHNIVCVGYGDDLQNIAIECETCYEVLIDVDKPNLIPWTELVLLDSDGKTELSMSDEHKNELLDEFRATGAMNGIFFAPLGLAHEDAEDASTWGPESPDVVDWDGFNAR